MGSQHYLTWASQDIQTPIDSVLELGEFLFPLQLCECFLFSTNFGAIHIFYPFWCSAEHKRDAARAENAVTLTYGSELIGMQRDWNEELQSCREFPHSTPQER